MKKKKLQVFHPLLNIDGEFYMDATIENFEGLLELYPSIKMEWNIVNAVRFEAYMFIKDNVLSWSHYGSIGHITGNPANKQKVKIAFSKLSNEFIRCSDYDKEHSVRGEPFFMLNGEKHHAHGGYRGYEHDVAHIERLTRNNRLEEE